MGRIGSGPIAPALLLLAGLALGLPQPALGQARRPAPAQPASQAQAPAPAPDQLTSMRMVWSMMAAVDHANRTGNYSVLRDLGTVAFQSRNNPASLATIFAGLREQNVDLSNTLVVTPLWEMPPSMVQPHVLRLRGRFPLRPAAIAFDILMTWDGAWRLEAIAVQALPG